MQKRIHLLDWQDNCEDKATEKGIPVSTLGYGFDQVVDWDFSGLWKGWTDDYQLSELRANVLPRNVCFNQLGVKATCHYRKQVLVLQWKGSQSYWCWIELIETFRLPKTA